MNKTLILYVLYFLQKSVNYLGSFKINTFCQKQLITIRHRVFSYLSTFSIYTVSWIDYLKKKINTNTDYRYKNLT